MLKILTNKIGKSPKIFIAISAFIFFAFNALSLEGFYVVIMCCFFIFVLNRVLSV